MRLLGGAHSGGGNQAEGIAGAHHEKWEGTGYPKGIKGREIPLVGRITALADVFDALTSRRPYKEPFTNDKAFAILQGDRDRHFDPHVVDAFFPAKAAILPVQARFSEREEGGDC